MNELDDISAPLASQAPAASSPMDDFSSPLARPSAQQKAVISANDNGEEAARALQIGKRTGIPASVVQSDIPGYDAHERQQSAVKAVQNPYIAKYVETSKHGAAISGDDYDKLEEASQALQALHPELVRGKAQAGLFQAVPEIAEMLTHAPGREKLYSALKELPAALGKGILDFFETPGKVASGEINLTTPAGLDQGISFGIGVALGGRDIRVGRAADTGAKPDSPANIDDFLAKVRGAKTRAEIDEFLASKQPGPPGAMLQIEHARVASEALDKAVEVAQESKTKVRSPETFAEFGAAHGTDVVHIDAAKIMELYQKEGKVPAEGDGLFGFVPGLAERAQSAAAVGGEVTIPVSQYVAHVDPAVHEGLRESVRLHDDGVTLEESKEIEKEVKAFDPEAGQETIKAAATKFGDKVYEGQTHADAYQKFVKETGGGDKEAGAAYRGDGFVTSAGRFVGREEAQRIADAAKQIDSNIIDRGDKQSQLYSEEFRKERGDLKLDTSVFMNLLIEKGVSLNITEGEFKAYSNKIANQEQAILDKAVTIGKREASKRLTPEWRANKERIRQEVEKEITQSPAYLADRYFNFDKGMLPNGKRILSDFFEPQDLASADSWAPIFGFETGSEMSSAVVAREAVRKESGKGANWQLKQEVAAEVAARMETQYGNLAENIAKEAREIALADHTFDVLAEEVRILARSSRTEPPLSRGEMVSWAKESFERSNITEAANWEKLRRAVERGGREAEKALLKGDFVEAFQWKQKQMLAAVLAKESLGLQKIVDQAEAKIDRFSSEEVIKGIDQAYLEQIRQMLASVGVEQQFASLQDTGPLRDFVADSEGQLAVAPWLTEGAPPAIKDMSVAEFRAFVDSMKSMEHVGRKAAQLENSRGKAELQNVIFDIKKELDRFPFIDQPALNQTLPQRLTSLGRKVVGAHLLVERMFDYTDRFNPHGPITEWLDRPLRDSNVKELQLTEQVTKMLRNLKQHTDASINNERVPNDLIPDAGDKTGFMAMTRHNLRQVMLNMGNWSNLKKLSEGFGVNEADLRRWVDQHARPQDVAWVNGVWKIFDHLKPEADAMQLRDTGVPADTIEGVPWDVKAGKLNGGYYPVVYDKFNSNIQGHMAAKNPVFDTHYVQATTPNGYTVARTDFEGALDLSGSFLSSRVQGMIHDIAFREAIRNANKLISSQEFRTALAQKWGKEAADLLPSWLRDIANSHTLDDNYAQGLVRAMSLIRQNVVSTLIAYNPGTFIKHGFTAAVMSADRVGAGPLLKAAGEIGVKGTAQIAKDLIVRPTAEADAAFMDAFRDSIDQGERGENARQFILASSAVMRNRQRQYDDSIRGAIDDMNKAGAVQTLANFRQRQMLYGRMAVAFSDGLSAMPTWLAAYKKAYLAGEEHADAVFIADKEVSRAHGSSFVGDQPAVTRIGNTLPGEIARWFVPLYKFWNHTVNNNFQLAWDTAAAIRGEKPGEAPEPGANAASIARRVGLILATIFIEEQATAALDEDKKGFLHAMAMSSIRYFGGGFVGLRELSNSLASGYEPSVGMLGTLFKAGTEVAKDMGLIKSFPPNDARNWIIHTATAIGMMTGVGGSQVGRTGSFTKDLITGKERPQTFNQYRQGFRTGHSKARYAK